MKFCKDCKFYREDDEILSYSERIDYEKWGGRGKCFHDYNTLNPLSGEKLDYNSPADDLRNENGVAGCGLEAKWFEPKEEES